MGQGTGLGLSQICGFIPQSGGIVQIETKPGKGTTVRLCPPFHALNRDSKAAEPAGKSRTALLVEDEQDVRELTAEQLRDLGYRVLKAEDGLAARRLVQAGAHLDLLINDVGLPGGGMNGRQVAEAVCGRYPELPVILITGYAARQQMLGMDVVIKPFDPATLVKLVGTKLKAISGAAGLNRHQTTESSALSGEPQDQGLCIVVRNRMDRCRYYHR